MALWNALRSFAITLVIAITVSGPQASGFTIYRSNLEQSTTLSTHPTSDDSPQLQVMDDLWRRNITEPTSNEDSQTTKSNYDFKTNINTVTKKPPDVTTKKPPRVAGTTIKVRSTTEDTRIPTISSDTVEVFDSIEDNRDFTKSQQNVENKKNIYEKLDESSPKLNKTLEINRTVITATEKAYQNATESDIKRTTKKMAIPHSVLENTTQTTLCDNCETTTESVNTPTLKINETNSDPLSSTPEDQSVSETSLLSTILSDDSNITTETTYLSSMFSDADITETSTDEINTEPDRGKYTKYTTIVRKRVTNSDDPVQTEGTQDNAMMMKVETSNTHLYFEKLSNVTQIPELDKLGNDSLSKTNRSISDERISEEVKTAEPNQIPTSHVIQNTDNAGTNRAEIVESKRAGFLDNSEKATTLLDASLPSITTKVNDTELHGAVVKDSEAIDTENPEIKRVSIYNESRSQLAEDAILEEFLKEEALNNHQENAHRLEQTDKLVKSDEQEILTVQPISSEQTRASLYTVNPNYKPMKKLDVQPAKPFVRDPDDNSWRNESISSLGIVFKPKNSSKSFKEVLKNKTQTELNNLQEKDTKDDVPDLRVRLEKIAEVRKTKKKKTNKDGELYSDYEEGNSAEIPKRDSMSPLLSVAGVTKLNTPLDVNPKLSTLTMNNLNSIKTDDMNKQFLFENSPVDSLTTAKPKKLFNIAEYYDSTDEYDADYVTMSNIDLKKFTPPKSTTTHTPFTAGLLLTRPAQPYFSDRKPTVQYFPPRGTQKVNVNNPDRDFERKINLFTFKDSPKVKPQLRFVTVPPMPIATKNLEGEMRHPMRPQSKPENGPERHEMRPTVKPTDFMMYTPEEFAKNYQVTNTPREMEPREGFLPNEETLNRGSYVIKHYKDFLEAAAKDNDDERGSDFLSQHTPTESSPDVTFGLLQMEKTTPGGREEEPDYDSHFRRELLHHFVDNFNQNSERFKVDFPILFNSSVVHRQGDGNGQGAASRAFLKRLYSSEGTATKNSPLKKPCEPACELVELSPAYELHYYVPGQEERAEAPPPAPPRPYRS